ncbi:MAG: protein TonB [Bacteroidia bacterium]|jgi:protein TonB
MTAGFNKHRYRNFFIGISMACGITLFAFNYKTNYTVGDVVEISPIDESEAIHIMSVTMPPPPPPAPKQKKQVKKAEPFKIEARIKFVTHTIVVPTQIEPPKPIAIPIITPAVGGIMPQPTKVHDWVNVKPEFPGGQKALNAFLKDNLRYPDDWLEIDEQGTIRIMFIVNEDGDITDIKILDDYESTSAGRESVRVIGLMPRWKPAMKAGKKVKTYFVQPIRFRIY